MRSAAALLALAACAAAATPSGLRPPDKGCAWKKLISPELGLAISHQRCDYGFRIVDFATLPGKRALYQTLKDKGAAKETFEPVIEIYEKRAEESPDAAIRRVAFGMLSRYKRKHCLVAAKRIASLGPGKEAYTISPDATYAAEVEAAAGGQIPDPPCGDLGELADGLTYFEFHPLENPRRFVFVSAGQDTPLFDQASLEFLSLQ